MTMSRSSSLYTFPNDRIHCLTLALSLLMRAAEQFPGVFYADLLSKFHLGVVELVHVAVDVIEVNILVVV